MEKIVLTVDSQYVDWGIAQGIRELMQNGIDADTKGFGLSVEYRNNTLRIRNDGITIPKSSLLIGYSTKKGDNTQIGEFGEGYKLGCMALVKRGLLVSISTGNEQWTPVIEWSEAFERDVLAFQITKTDTGANAAKRVEFVISGLTAEDWDDAKRQFLMFDDKRKYNSFVASNGNILLSGPDYRGRIYINGILIEQITDEGFEYGYNFRPGVVRVDRDRRMASRYEIRSATAQTLFALAKQDSDAFVPKIEALLRDNAADIRDTYEMPKWIAEILHDSFVQNYGSDCLPVNNDNDIKEAGHYGKRGKVFGAAYVALLQGMSEDLNLAMLRGTFGRKVQKVCNLLELRRTEQKNLLKAQQAVELACERLPPIEVSEFVKNSNILGLYHNGSDKVTLNRTILKDYGKTLSTLVHEVAHRAGDDGTKEHDDEMTRIWVAIVVSKGKRKKV